jgi:hypothetical protein
MVLLTLEAAVPAVSEPWFVADAQFKSVMAPGHNPLLVHVGKPLQFVST